MQLLFISNGHGEDALGAELAKTIQSIAPVEIVAAPLVGRGMAYEKAGLNVVGPRKEMPSGGFMFTSLGVLWKDLQSGFISMSQKQYKAIKNTKSDAVIVVGDIYALWVADRYAKNKPIFQVQPLVSLYYQEGMTAKDKLSRLNRTTVDNFVWFERFLMKKIESVYVRDQLSAVWLNENGVKNAKYLGNIMMDLVQKPETDIGPVLDGRPIVGFLPGTRDDYLFSFPIMLNVAEKLPDFQCLTALNTDLSGVKLPENWMFEETTGQEKAVSAETAAVNTDGTRVLILKNAFSAVLHKSDIIVGTSGTANEQAVGLGKPVIGFFTEGPQYLPSFAKAQKRLLGENLFLEEANAEDITSKIKEIYGDNVLKEGLFKLGQQRIGTRGSEKIAKEILERVRNKITKQI